MSHCQHLRLSPEYQQVCQWTQPGARILDLGCGDGKLLHHLHQNHHTQGYGIEVDAQHMVQAMNRGVNVLQLNLNELRLTDMFEAQSFEHVIMTQTLQVVERPDQLLQDMVSIGQSAMVTFPNFGHWKIRTKLLFSGRAPESRTLPYRWYNTPNIRVLSFDDFENLCAQLGIQILDRQVVNLSRQANDHSWLQRQWPNLFGELGVYHIAK